MDKTQFIHLLIIAFFYSFIHSFIIYSFIHLFINTAAMVSDDPANMAQFPMSVGMVVQYQKTGFPIYNIM